jgi:hypothetical protein
MHASNCHCRPCLVRPRGASETNRRRQRARLLQEIADQRVREAEKEIGGHWGSSVLDFDTDDFIGRL